MSCIWIDKEGGLVNKIGSSVKGEFLFKILRATPEAFLEAEAKFRVMWLSEY